MLELSTQLTGYWEKTFKVDLFRPQIGVVNVTDVSSPHRYTAELQPSYSYSTHKHVFFIDTVMRLAELPFEMNLRSGNWVLHNKKRDVI